MYKIISILQRPKEPDKKKTPKKINLMKEKYRDRAHGIEFSSQYQNPQQILKGLPNSQNVTSLSSSDISNKPHQNHVASPQSPYETDPRLSQVSHSVHTHKIRVIPLG